MPGSSISYSDNSYFLKAINGVSSLYQFAANTIFSIPRAFSDTYKIWNNRENFIMSELSQRAETSHIAFGDLGLPFSCLPKIVLVTGGRANILQVADYGEKNGDRAARNLFKDVVDMAGAKTIVNMQGSEAAQQRGKLKPHLLGDLSLAIASEVSQQVFEKGIKNWDYESSFQDNITHIIINVLGNCVYGIPYVEMKYVPVVRNAQSLLFENNAKSAEFIRTKNKMSDMNKALMTEHAASIFNSENYIKSQIELDGTEAEEEKIQMLIDAHGASGFLVEGNLSGITMVAIAYINQSEEIKKNLQEEIRLHADKNIRPDAKTLLNKTDFPYLQCIYKEALRFLTPHALLVRQTSKPTTLKIKDAWGKSTTYSIPRHSVLFSPIRAIHHDPKYWENPESFNPSRFLNNAENEHFFPFSLGVRSCPASTGFVEVVFKVMILESMKYDIQLDQQVEDIAVDTIHAHWKKEYFVNDISCRSESAPRLA